MKLNKLNQGVSIGSRAHLKKDTKTEVIFIYIKN
jgi:hypothetical protein